MNTIARKLAFSAWAALFLLSVTATYVARVDAAQALPKVPYLDTVTGCGSGVVVADGWVLTADHLDVVTDAEESHPHPTKDLRLVKISAVRGSITYGAAPKFGEPVTSIGWHFGEVKLACDGRQGLPSGPLCSMSAEVTPGTSGGPVLDAEGRLVGIIARVWHCHAVDSEKEESSKYYVTVPHIGFYTPITPAVRAWIAKHVNP